LRVLRTCAYKIAVVACLFALWTASSRSASAQASTPLRGRVVFPDGTPAPGATVTVKTACDDMGYHLVSQAKTSEDGTFSIPPFGENCRRFQFTASKRSDFWMETGEDNLNGGLNGTSPAIDLSLTPDPSPVTIKLGQQGGRVDVQVWDIATERFVYATLSLKHQPAAGRIFGSEMFATGKNGSSETLLLPPGEYFVNIDSYQCRDRQYVPPEQLCFPLSVASGTQQRKELQIDVRLIKAMRAFGTPYGRKCSP
jgi:hypothetical protein